MSDSFDQLRKVRYENEKELPPVLCDVKPMNQNSHDWLWSALRWLAIFPVIVFLNIFIGAVNGKTGWLGELFIAWVYPLTAIPTGSAIAPSHRVVTSYVLAALIGWPVLVAPALWAFLGYLFLSKGADFNLDFEKIKDLFYITLLSIIGCFSVIQGIRIVKEKESEQG